MYDVMFEDGVIFSTDVNSLKLGDVSCAATPECVI